MHRRVLKLQGESPAFWFPCAGVSAANKTENAHDVETSDRSPGIMSGPDHAPKLEQLLTGSQLPALPQSAIRLLELSRDPDNGPAEFAVPIESDPGLTSQVLRFVNSSYFGFSREISSVKLAITLVVRPCRKLCHRVGGQAHLSTGPPCHRHVQAAQRHSAMPALRSPSNK